MILSWMRGWTCARPSDRPLHITSGVPTYMCSRSNVEVFVIVYLLRVVVMHRCMFVCAESPAGVVHRICSCNDVGTAVATRRPMLLGAPVLVVGMGEQVHDRKVGISYATPTRHAHMSPPTLWGENYVVVATCVLVFVLPRCC
jgi:hypothetical protein